VHEVHGERRDSGAQSARVDLAARDRRSMIAALQRARPPRSAPAAPLASCRLLEIVGDQEAQHAGDFADALGHAPERGEPVAPQRPGVWHPPRPDRRGVMLDGRDDQLRSVRPLRGSTLRNVSWGLRATLGLFWPSSQKKAAHRAPCRLVPAVRSGGFEGIRDRWRRSFGSGPCGRFFDQSPGSSAAVRLGPSAGPSPASGWRLASALRVPLGPSIPSM